MFKFIKNGKEVTDNRIHWKFKGTDLEFRSDAEKLDRNVQFWRNKYKVGPDVEVEFLNVKKAEENVKPIITEPSIESNDIVDNHIAIEKPVVSQDLADTNDTPKRKRKSKTTDL